WVVGDAVVMGLPPRVLEPRSAGREPGSSVARCTAMDLPWRGDRQRQVPECARGVPACCTNLESRVSNPFGEGNCQLESAGIAGTRTPSAAASNHQLCWVFLEPVTFRWNGSVELPRAGGSRPRPRSASPAHAGDAGTAYLSSAVAPAASRSFL